MNPNQNYPIKKAVTQATSLLDQWRSRPDLADASEALDRMGLAVREWFSVLSRFTEFYGDAPRIQCGFYLDQGRIVCMIADNSDGVRFAGATWGTREGADRSRETALLYLQLLADSASYRRSGGRNLLRLEVDLSALSSTHVDTVEPLPTDLRELLRTALSDRRAPLAA